MSDVSRESVIAYRAWGIAEVRPRLGWNGPDVGDTYFMLAPVVTESHLLSWKGLVSSSHELPKSSNRCGIYGFKSRDVFDYVMGRQGTYACNGSFEGFGHIVEHEFGYRVQHAIVQDIEIQLDDEGFIHNLLLADEIVLPEGDWRRAQSETTLGSTKRVNTEAQWSYTPRSRRLGPYETTPQRKAVPIKKLVADLMSRYQVEATVTFFKYKERK